MTYSHYRKSDGNLNNRKKLGRWIKSKRVQMDLTQKDVADHMGYGYTVMVSSVERGINRIPPEDWQKWAEILKVPVQEFAIRAFRHYDPLVADLVLGAEVDGNK